MQNIDELVRKLEAKADPESLAIARELVQAVMELYGTGLERIAEILAKRGEAGVRILDDLSRDELVGNLMAANGLHPQDLESRVREAVEKLRARLRAQGSVHFLGIEDGVIRLRASSALKSTVEAAMYEAAPDLTRVVIEEVEDRGPAAGFVPVEMLMGYGAARP